MSTKVEGWILDAAVSPCASLTQGDLIFFEKEEDPLRRSGIVVTADCDLEKGKHARLVTLIPVVSVRELLENYLFLEDCEGKRDSIRHFAFRSFEVEKSSEVEVRLAILKDKVAGCSLREDDPILLAAKVALGDLNFISVASYKALMSAVKSDLKKASSLSQQIGSRGDVLNLPCTKALGIEGSIAWVRHIWQVPLNSIAIRTSEISKRPGERIARLDSPFRYRLTQIMAQVFSDIGLPDIPKVLEESVDEVYRSV
ncbi:hypothetical protein G7007_04490 [Pseudomonas entomophila]|uniref:hypothetical protein n=1 Tax=Pseudomonas entomophila TaxID=312306 RepID=UPI0015E433B2|nr:hypothetical protein [Pseudomonas entomophila]MBA1192124.1 hypothetical protein [Pseudomonas entomophila]